MRRALGREEPIVFMPVPRLRNRRNGRRAAEGSGGAQRRWKADRRGDAKAQADFIAALSLCGSVRAAAEAVGLSARSAYKLLDAPSADDFARASDEALDTCLTETAKRESGLPRLLLAQLTQFSRRRGVKFVNFRHFATVTTGEDSR